MTSAKLSLHGQSSEDEFNQNSKQKYLLNNDGNRSYKRLKTETTEYIDVLSSTLHIVKKEVRSTALIQYVLLKKCLFSYCGYYIYKSLLINIL